MQQSDFGLLRFHSYVNGQWLENSDTLSVVNPSTEALIAQVSNAGPEQAVMAIDGAKSALNSWRDTSPKTRASILSRWHDLMLENQDELAKILTLEQGKPLAEAKGEIAYSASFLLWFAEEAKRIYGDVIASDNNSQRILVLKQPIGVVTAITPWNFPSAMIMRKAAAALAAGCTFVVRPDPQTPLSALALAELASQAGVPAGVFNVVVGLDADAIGKVLTTHPSVNKFTFTGSTPVGKLLLERCAKGVKKASMELGGNAPLIVFDDADIDAAINGAINSKFRNAGQTCICTNRIYVHSDIAEQFTQRLIESVGQLRVGDGLKEGVHIGPLISHKALARVESLVQSSIAQGAEPALGGHTLEVKGHFYQPTILTQVTDDMPVCQEEIFGPVLPIITFTDEQEVIERANNTPFGLAAYFYTNNIKRLWKVAERLDYGMVGINDTQISTARAPFGGVKESGYGREGSKYGLDDYLVTKYLCMGNV